MFAADPITAIAHAFQFLEQSGVTNLTTNDAKEIVTAKDPLARANEMVAKSGEVMVISEGENPGDYWQDCLWVGIFWTLTLIGKTLTMLFSAVILPTSIRILHEVRKKGGNCKKCDGPEKSCGWHTYCGGLCFTSFFLLIISLAAGLQYAYGENFRIWPWIGSLINLTGGKPTLRVAIYLIGVANLVSGLIEIGHCLKKRKAEELAGPAPTTASPS